MRLKIHRYNYDVDSLFEFRNLLGNLDGGVHAAINLYVAKDERFRSWLVRVNWDDALAGSAIVLFRILEIHQPADNDKSRIDSVLQLLEEFSDKASPKLSGLTAAVAADMFDFLTLRNNSEALIYLADELVKRTSTEGGLRMMQLIMAPKTALSAEVTTTLYPELRKAVERQEEFKEWFDRIIPKSLMLRAYQSTQFDEAIPNASKRQRGKMLEMALGF
jgi:hypothetical protein